MGLIVYLLDQPLDSRNRKRFGIQSWLNKGWTVEVWDLTPWIYPGVWAAFTGTQSWRASSFPECITVVSKAALLRLSQRRPALYIDETGDSYPALYARLFLRRRGASRVVCNLGVLPGYSDAKNTLVAKLQRAISKGPARMLNLIHRSLLRTLAARLCKPDVMVISGERSKPSVRHRAEIIWTHNFDYDIYLSQKTLVDTPAEEGYAVFSPAEVGPRDQIMNRSWYMRKDIQALLQSDAVMMLQDWEQSEGARLEFEIAKQLELPVKFMTINPKGEV